VEWKRLLKSLIMVLSGAEDIRPKAGRPHLRMVKVKSTVSQHMPWHQMAPRSSPCDYQTAAELDLKLTAGHGRIRI
jgi:hypothetical protein